MRVRHDGAAVRFRCPGCGDEHYLPTDRWAWNGDLDRPTLAPSVLVLSGHYVSTWKPGEGCWCGKNYRFSCMRCHSFVLDGRIEFLTDSTHELAGQTVDLPEIVLDTEPES